MDDCRQYLLGAGVETKSSDTRKSLEGTFWFNTVIHDRLVLTGLNYRFYFLFFILQPRSFSE